jgi:hypothetical protein
VNAGKIAEYAVGIFVPLGMFWAGEQEWFRRSGMGKSTPDSARGGSPESKAKKGALPPLRSPFLGSGTSRIPADVPEIQDWSLPEV